MLTVHDLITRAFRLARVYRASQDLTDIDLENAVDYLNLAIADINTDGAEISLNSFFTTSLESGKSLVSLPEFIKINTIYFLLGNVRIPIELMSID